RRAGPQFPDVVGAERAQGGVGGWGCWPRGGPLPRPPYYAYAYPEPAGFSAAKVAPASASYSKDLHEFILPYDAVRTAGSPDEVLLAFLQSTYEAAADLARWDRAALERPVPSPGSGHAARQP